MKATKPSFLLAYVSFECVLCCWPVIGEWTTSQQYCRCECKPSRVACLLFTLFMKFCGRFAYCYCIHGGKAGRTCYVDAGLSLCCLICKWQIFCFFLHCVLASGTVYCNRSCLYVYVFVCGGPLGRQCPNLTTASVHAVFASRSAFFTFFNVSCMSVFFSVFTTSHSLYVVWLRNSCCFTCVVIKTMLGSCFKCEKCLERCKHCMLAVVRRSRIFLPLRRSPSRGLETAKI